MDRVLWAITYLRKAGLIEAVSRGVFRITTRGMALLAEKPKTLTMKDLERYPECLEFRNRKKSEGEGGATRTSVGPIGFPKYPSRGASADL